MDTLDNIMIPWTTGCCGSWWGGLKTGRLEAYRHPLVVVYFFLYVSPVCGRRSGKTMDRHAIYYYTMARAGIVMKPFLKAGEEEKDIQHILLPMRIILMYTLLITLPISGPYPESSQ